MNPSQITATHPTDTAEADGAAVDSVLLARVRLGDVSAYAELYDRHHDAALGLARSYAGRSGAEDLVSDAFARTLRLLLDGRGPAQSFRAYLFTAIRNNHVSVARKDNRVLPVADFTDLENDHTDPDPWPELVENQLVAAALATLPERWQQIIRLTTIEELPLDRAAEIVGISTGAAAQLAYRAREALRLAYLAQHVPEPEADDCRTVVPLLTKDARSSSPTRTARVDAHLDGCAPCRSARTEIVAVAGTMRPTNRS